jgi:hypothetical protein
MARIEQRRWVFASRFRRGAFGWRSQPAVQRVREAVAEIKKVARTDPVLAGDGAVLFLEKVSPALEHVDSSSGAIGSAVNRAVEELARVIAAAPADAETRDRWLVRLWEAHEADQIPYIEILGEFWGELCGSKATASQWADRLVGTVRMAWSPDPGRGGFFHGTWACLSALYRAERYEELVGLLRLDRLRFWPYQRWGVRALVAMGQRAAAIRLAESCRRQDADDRAIALACEEMLLSSGLAEEAYQRYAIVANQRSSYLATFRAIVGKYPQRQPAEVLGDLVASTPGQEGKWFAAARNAKLYDAAIELAGRSPCDPRTLTRAARDCAQTQPEFAVEAGMAALHWLVRGYGYEVSVTDVWAAYSHAMRAADRIGCCGAVRERVRRLVAGEAAEAVGSRLVAEVLGREIGVV